MKRHLSSVMPLVALLGNCTTGLRMESPTQVIRVSRWPNPSSTCCVTLSMSALLVASPVRAKASRPKSRTSSATLLTPVRVRALTATSAPASAKARAIPLPMPRPHPTISTFCPVMSNSGILIMLSLVSSDDRGLAPYRGGRVVFAGGRVSLATAMRTGTAATAQSWASPAWP
ncbi:hypothetical protein NKDENANG_02235 [Candidatus Entotheonellaceae bacterium PAL068K]